MAKIYLEEKKFYVMSEDNIVYKVDCFQSNSGYDVLCFNLNIVTGLEYSNEYDDTIGWCSPDTFSNDIQEDIVIQYFMEESAREAFESNGYTILKLEEISDRLKKAIEKYDK